MEPVLTYREVGATAGAMPLGYHLLEASQQIGSGRRTFEVAANRLRHWGMQRGAGLRVEGHREVRLGDDAVVVIGLGPLKLRAPVRIVAVVDDPDEIGFAYGTLTGHLECGEERFTVQWRPDDSVWASVRAFSKPGRWYARLGGPVTRLLQRRITQRYLDALAD